VVIGRLLLVMLMIVVLCIGMVLFLLISCSVMFWMLRKNVRVMMNDGMLRCVISSLIVVLMIRLVMMVVSIEIGYG